MTRFNSSIILQPPNSPCVKRAALELACAPNSAFNQIRGRHPKSETQVASATAKRDSARLRMNFITGLPGLALLFTNVVARDPVRASAKGQLRPPRPGQTSDGIQATVARAHQP
jgi:hypothetical protein